MIASKSKENQQVPLFAYSISRPITFTILSLVMFVPIGILGLAYDDIAGGLFFFLIDSLVAASAWRAYRNQVHESLFFSGYAWLRGRDKLNIKIAYPEIKQVEKLVRFPLISPRTQVRIRVRGKEQDPFLIPANPYNKNLKCDLYSWLENRASTTNSMEDQ